MDTKKRIFYPGMYYVVDENNTVVFESKDINECKRGAIEGDMILICIDAKKSSINTPNVPPAPVKADKIVLDFNKKLLTITGGSVKLGDACYNDGKYEVALDKWLELVKECNKRADVVEFVGTPPIDGKDITNEMSDL